MALGGKSSPTLGRDTMFAVLMIVLKAGLGPCLLLGGIGCELFCDQSKLRLY